MVISWEYDRTKDADVITVPDASGNEWRVWVSENPDHRWDVTCDWGDTYRGAPTRGQALDIAVRFIRQRIG